MLEQNFGNGKARWSKSVCIYVGSFLFQFSVLVEQLMCQNPTKSFSFVKRRKTRWIFFTSDHTIVRSNQIPDPVILVWEHTVCDGLGLIRGHFRMAPQPGKDSISHLKGDLMENLTIQDEVDDNISGQQNSSRTQLARLQSLWSTKSCG